MIIAGTDYEILQTLHRRPGSLNQVLTECDQGIEKRRRYYVGKAPDGELYFIKEYVDWNYGGHLPFPENIQYEFDTSCRYDGFTDECQSLKLGVEGYVMLYPVKAVAVGDNRIVFPYYEGYSTLSQLFHFKKERLEAIRAIIRVVKVWAKKENAINYDLCENNTMIRVTGGTTIDIKMIDFERANRPDIKFRLNTSWSQAQFGDSL